MSTTFETEKARARALISQCVAIGLIHEEDGKITVFFEPDDGSEGKWVKMPIDTAAEDLATQNAFDILEKAIEEEKSKTATLIEKCFEKGILKENEGIIEFPYCALEKDGSVVKWSCREELFEDLLYQHSWLQKDYHYNLRSRDYLYAWYDAYVKTEKEFPVLHDMLFDHSGDDLLFSAGPDEHKIYYFNPDSNCGGQIVICPLDDDMARRIIDGEEWIEVVAEVPQYLADINHGSFFDAIEELIDGYKKGKFIASGIDSENLSKLLKNSHHKQTTQM